MEQHEESRAHTCTGHLAGFRHQTPQDDGTVWTQLATSGSTSDVQTTRHGCEHQRRGAPRRGVWNDVELEAPGRTQDARHATLRTEVAGR